MSIKTKLGGVAFAAAMALGSTPALADTFVINVPSGNPSVATFGNSPGEGKFIDTFLFNLPAAGKVTIRLESFDSGVDTNVNFNATGVKFNNIVVPYITRGVYELRLRIGQMVTGGQSKLVVPGQSDTFGTYNGTLTYSIPEPGTWALMILGFGFVGAGLRSRRAKARLAAA